MNKHDDKGNVTAEALNEPQDETHQPLPQMGNPPADKSADNPPADKSADNPPADKSADEIEMDVSHEELLAEMPEIRVVNKKNELSVTISVKWNGKQTHLWATTINGARQKAHAWLISNGYPPEGLDINYKKE